jgi:hypothetical protein
MKLKLRRRSVYVGTVVALIAMLSGFALAASLGSIGGSTGQSGYSTTITASAWAGTVTITPVPDSAQSGCSSGTLSGATPSYYTAAASGVDQCVAGDFYEELSFTPTTAVPLSTSAKFSVYADAADSAYDVTVTLVTQASGTTTSLALYVDFTSSTTGPDIPTSITVVVQN